MRNLEILCDICYQLSTGMRYPSIEHLHYTMKEAMHITSIHTEYFHNTESAEREEEGEELPPLQQKNTGYGFSDPIATKDDDCFNGISNGGKQGPAPEGSQTGHRIQVPDEACAEWSVFNARTRGE